MAVFRERHGAPRGDSIYSHADLRQDGKMDKDLNTTGEVPSGRRIGCLQVSGLLLLVAIVTAVVTFFVVRSYLAPPDFDPVTLSAKEERVLNAKLDRFDPLSGKDEEAGEAALTPEAYSEEGASRAITFTEKELNALLANNTDLARKLALDLSDGLLSAKLLVPLDEDFPVMGGKVLKLRAGLELAYEDDKPIVILKGVSVMGVPVPNAWLGGLKNIDLVKEYGDAEGPWKVFAGGVEKLSVEEGHLRIELKE